MSDTYRNYEFTITVKTNHDPRTAIFEIVDKLKGILPVVSIKHELIEERPTDVEHHGGLQNDHTQLETPFQEGTQADLKTPSY